MTSTSTGSGVDGQRVRAASWSPGLLTRLRARFDYIAYTYGRFWPLAASATLFALAILVETPSLPSQWVLIVIAIGFIGSFTLLLREIRHARQEITEYTVDRLSRLPGVPDHLPPGMRALPIGRQVDQGGVEHIIITDEHINTRLDQLHIEIDIATGEFRLPESLLTVGRRSLRLARKAEKREGRAKHATRFNGRLARLSSDLTAGEAGGASVCLQRVRYFDGESSNELWPLEFAFRGSSIENPAQAYLLGHAGELLPIGATRLANIVGITQLAVTSDDMVVFVRQSRRNSVAPDSVSASASGSLEWRDVSRGHRSLRDVLLRGMLRELREESGVDEGEVLDAHLTSYYRWWNRGAKPEFTAVARLSCAWADLRGRRLTSREKEFTSARFGVPLSALLTGASAELAAQWEWRLPRSVVADAWSQAFARDPRTAADLPVNPSCEAAWRASVGVLLQWAR